MLQILVQQSVCSTFTFPLVEFALLPSGSSEKSVSEENRVSVSLIEMNTSMNYHINLNFTDKWKVK